MFFWIMFFIGNILLLLIHIISKKIKRETNKRIFKIIIFIAMLIFAFIASIGGWKGNTYFLYFMVEFMLGIIVFIYSVYYTIRFKKFNYWILTPFLLVSFCFAGIYYGERNERMIHKIDDRIKNYYDKNGNYDNRIKLFEYINAPKNMEIIIDENDEVIIKYKNMIFYSNKRIMKNNN